MEYSDTAVSKPEVTMMWKKKLKVQYMKLKQIKRRRRACEVKHAWKRTRKHVLDLRTNDNYRRRERKNSGSKTGDPPAHTSSMNETTGTNSDNDDMSEEDESFYIDKSIESDDEVHCKSGCSDNGLFVDLANILSTHDLNKAKEFESRKLEESEIEGKNVASGETHSETAIDFNESKRAARKLPSMKVFEEISKIFANAGEPEVLQDIYVALTKRLDSNVMLSICPSNINGDDAASLPSERTYSCHTLFGRRCFKDDCSIHGPHNNTDPNSQQKEEPRLKFSEPCGTDCYKHLEDVKQKMAAIKKREEKDTQYITRIIEKQVSIDWSNDERCEDNTNSSTLTADSNFCDDEENMNPNTKSENNEEQHQMDKASSCALLNREERKGNENNELTWKRSEEIMFRELYNVFPTNPCEIAQIMQTKSCQEIYKFAIEDHNILVIKNNEDSTPQQTEKKELGLWSCNCKKIQSVSEYAPILVHNFKPCNHPDRTCDESCPCISKHNFCEKYCQCSPDCQNQFKGCRCKAQCNTKQCPCYLAVRECDPDLCQTCGADQSQLENISCKNVSIQRGLQKHLLITPSDVSGWGILLKESAAENEFIVEYFGEIVSQDEADRIGIGYDKQKCSFLYNLSDMYATHRGNEIHLDNRPFNPNCYAKVMMVNGDHRIGIFAKRTIQPGEELFFDCRYGPTEQSRLVGHECRAEKF